MASCKKAIFDIIDKGLVDTLPVLSPKTRTRFETTLTNCQLFVIRPDIYQTMYFTTKIDSINTIFSIELYDIATKSLFGKVDINQITNTSSLDIFAGEYILCMSTNQMKVSGEIIIDYTSYIYSQRLNSNYYFGSSLSYQFKKEPRPPVECKETIYMEIVDGKLPPNIKMNKLGRIEGYLPNLDCIDDTANLSPSNNWQYDDGGLTYPWGKQWRFKVKAYLANNSSYVNSNVVEQWFCIRIYNNWDFDRDNFIKQAPFKKVREYEIVEQPKELPKTMCLVRCDEIEDPSITQLKEIESKCDACDATDELIVQLIEIPSSICPCNMYEDKEIIEWFKSVDLNGDKGCPELQKFISDAKASELFSKYLNYENNINSTIRIVNNTIELTEISYEKYENELRGVDLSKMINEMRVQVNNSLDFFNQYHFGIACSVDITNERELKRI